MIADGRFLLECFPDGAVLADLRSGALYLLNESAAFVWMRALDGDREDRIASTLADRYDISLSVAQHDVATVLSPHDPVVVAGTGASQEFSYEAIDEGYRLSHLGAPKLDIAADGCGVRLCEPMPPVDLWSYLRAVVPRLLSLQGHAILHASAVARPEGAVVAILGNSGAGKTTTGRAFTDSGWLPVCEDKLVLGAGDSGVSAVLDGEPRIGVFLESLRAETASAPVGVWRRFNPIERLTDGRSVPVEGILCIASSRRAGSTIRGEVLHSAAAAIEILRHTFHGSFASDAWARQLRTACALARTARTSVATMPAGLPSLRTAVRNYTLTTTS